MPRALPAFYYERFKVPKYTSLQTVLSLSYTDAGRELRHRLRGTKDDHLERARTFLAERRRLQAEYQAHLRRELGFLRAAGVDPGPLISGIVSDRFPERVKDGLREQNRAINDLGDAAAAHAAAARLRVETFRRML